MEDELLTKPDCSKLQTMLLLFLSESLWLDFLFLKDDPIQNGISKRWWNKERRRHLTVILAKWSDLTFEASALRGRKCGHKSSHYSVMSLFQSYLWFVTHHSSGNLQHYSAQPTVPYSTLLQTLHTDMCAPTKMAEHFLSCTAADIGAVSDVWILSTKIETLWLTFSYELWCSLVACKIHIWVWPASQFSLNARWLCIVLAFVLYNRFLCRTVL